MIKGLPYFKFYPAEYLKGRITLCSREAQGLFINICTFYWMYNGKLNVPDIQDRFALCEDELKELIKKKVVHIYENDMVSIKFLDEQLLEFGYKKEMAITAGKESGKMRRRKKEASVERPLNDSRTIKDRDKDKDKKENILKENIEKTRNTIPPTLKMVHAYCLERNNKIEPEYFLDFYTSKGWKIGANKMKDWQAAIRTWERSNQKRNKSPNTIGSRSTGNHPPKKYRKSKLL